jgi:hypothetical protein
MDTTGIQPGDLIPDSELSTDRLVNYILTAVGACATLFRIWDRVHHPNRQFKGDDVAAIVCTILQLIFLIISNLYMQDPGTSPFGLFSDRFY